MRLAHLDILLSSGIIPYIFLGMSHMFLTEARKVLREKSWGGWGRGRGIRKGTTTKKTLFLLSGNHLDSNPSL